MHQPRPMDDWLKKYINKYDRWLEQDRIPFSSKVIPVSRSLDSTPVILPSSKVLEYLSQAHSIALTDCACRIHYRRCDNPTEVCLFLDPTADILAQKGKARLVTVETATAQLELADRHGLVHLALCSPDQYPYAICSCCSCCCHDLQLLLNHERTDLVARSGYVAFHDPDICIGCGVCADRCVFGARITADGTPVFDPGQCYGCGLCVSTCPVEAIRMEAQQE